MIYLIPDAFDSDAIPEMVIPFNGLHVSSMKSDLFAVSDEETSQSIVFGLE